MNVSEDHQHIPGCKCCECKDEDVDLYGEEENPDPNDVDWVQMGWDSPMGNR